LIVVNNGSTDHSLDTIKKYSNYVKIVDQPNMGQSGGRNSGLKIATGDYIAFLDADDYWLPEKLEKQVALLSDKTRLVYCGILQVSEKNPLKQFSTLPIFRGQCRYFYISRPGASIVLSGESTAIFERNLIEEIGFFDAQLESTAGWDFFRRCANVTGFDFVNEALSIRREHDSNMSKDYKKTIEDYRKAYTKLVRDPNSEISLKDKDALLIKLEIMYLKTYIKRLNLFGFLESFFRLLRKEFMVEQKYLPN
jgi:glycosyltransferase involved in cell wall biosynthesis